MSRSLFRVIFVLLLFAAPAWARQGENSGRLRSNVDLRFYGYLKLDAAYDSSRSAVGDFVKWVEPAPGNPGDDAFSMTANQSRLGLELEPRAQDSESRNRLETRGRIEVDFYGGGAANKPRPMLRHAYFEAVWAERELELIAGQTSDVISPLNPKTVNYSPVWWAGNIGYRRPQVRLTRRYDLGTGHRLEWAAALARSIGATDSEFTSNDAGSDSGLPSLQARLGIKLTQGPSFGVSGHFGQEEFDLDPEGRAETFDSWSLNLDYRQKLTRRIAVQAEAFTGTNLQSYLGGIGQGVHLADRQEIAASGGWLSLDFGPYERTAREGSSWEYHVGASVDDVRDADVATGARTRNGVIFANGLYSFNHRLQIGTELSWWSTSFQNQDDASTVRGQFSLLYRF